MPFITEALIKGHLFFKNTKWELQTKKLYCNMNETSFFEGGWGGEWRIRISIRMNIKTKDGSGSAQKRKVTDPQ
jgi:hypothetical protein